MFKFFLQRYCFTLGGLLGFRQQPYGIPESLLIKGETDERGVDEWGWFTRLVRPVRSVTLQSRESPRVREIPRTPVLRRSPRLVDW